MKPEDYTKATPIIKDIEELKEQFEKFNKLKGLDVYDSLNVGGHNGYNIWKHSKLLELNPTFIGDIVDQIGCVFVTSIERLEEELEAIGKEETKGIYQQTVEKPAHDSEITTAEIDEILKEHLNYINQQEKGEIVPEKPLSEILLDGSLGGEKP